MSESKSLVSKLAEVMAEIGHVPKRGVNSFHNYKYVMEADLCEAVREKLAARKVVMIPSVIQTSREKVTLTNKRGETADSMITDVLVEYTLMDGESDERIVFKMPGCGSDTGDKGVYKAITGSDKYALMKAFLIPTGDDPEADPETDARAEGFKRGSTADQQAVAKEKIQSFSEKHAALKESSKVVKPSELQEGEQVIQGVLDSISAEKKTTKDKPYVTIEVGGHSMNVFDKAVFTARRGEKSPLHALLGQPFSVICNKQGKFLNFVAIAKGDVQIEDSPEDPFALTEPADGDIPF